LATLTSLAFESLVNTADISLIEEHRLQEQVRLDALKNAAERNKWGQFATPPELAQSIARYALAAMQGESIRFLDPAIGTGSFFSALIRESSQNSIESAVGIELDPLFAATASSLWAGSGLEVIQGDFTRQPVANERFSLVLANPPYVRHHHLSTDDKCRLKARLAESLHIEISGLAGLYCYFMLLAHDWMADQGLAVWLIPSEFMDVNYGSALRRYLTESVTLLHIHRFRPEDVQFTDALVSSAIVVFRKSLPPVGHCARFSLGGSIEAPASEASIPLCTLARSGKWTQILESAGAERNSEPTLGDLFFIKRGLATGANDFFILTDAEAEHWDIPREFLKPILPSPRYLDEDVVGALSSGTPSISQRLYLLDCTESEEEIRVRWPRFYEYLQTGREQKIHLSYLTSRRVPWYSQEKRPPAPFLCTYMGRSANGKPPFRFLWNQSNATAHNVYLMLYPRGSLREILEQHPEMAARVFQALQLITPAQMVSEGRVYGGGLHKVEPKELAQIPARTVIESMAAYLQFEHQASLFN
jgi:predicted RNA methylase